MLSLSDDQLQLAANKVAKQLQGQQPNTSSALSVEVTASATSPPSTLVSQSVPTLFSAAATASNATIEVGTYSDSVTSTESIFQALDVNDTDAIKQKIINSEYGDLGMLPQRRLGPDKSKCLTIEDGLLVVQSKPYRIRITDINQWTDAF